MFPGISGFIFIIEIVPVQSWTVCLNYVYIHLFYKMLGIIIERQFHFKVGLFAMCKKWAYIYLDSILDIVNDTIYTVVYIFSFLLLKDKLCKTIFSKHM